MEMARAVFDITWNVIITGYNRVKQYEETSKLFGEMEQNGVVPTSVTLVSLLSAFSKLRDLEVGKRVHKYIKKCDIEPILILENALMDMYAACGEMGVAVGVFDRMKTRDVISVTTIVSGFVNKGEVDLARSYFDQMPERDYVSWTARIDGYIRVNCFKSALVLFRKMQASNIRPDEFTMMKEESSLYWRMTTEYGVEPNLAHYGCMVDLLGRAGHLQKACEVIKSMPMKPNSIVWGALLGACRVHKDVELAEMEAKQTLELDSENGAVYVLLYASCKRWDSLHELRESMMHRRIKKTPGCSLIEMNGVVHELVAGDMSHHQSEEIYLKLDNMTRDIKLAGYSPDASEVFLDVGVEDKESTLYWHSENLASAFGLISSGPAVTIRIVKNLRMCVDCHRVARLVSKLYNREVIVRDRTRFHHFRLGSWSCKDYW
ncbi:hypothetical protein REPUB_Repub13aG0154600 [Reevesia pubescens]